MFSLHELLNGHSFQADYLKTTYSTFDHCLFDDHKKGRNGQNEQKWRKMQMKWKNTTTNKKPTRNTKWEEWYDRHI